MATAMGNEHGCSFKGQRDTKLKHTGSRSTKELLRSQTTFLRLCSALKETFCSQEQKLRNCFRASNQPTQGHTKDFQTHYHHSRYDPVTQDCPVQTCLVLAPAFPNGQTAEACLVATNGSLLQGCFFLTPTGTSIPPSAHCLAHQSQSSVRRQLVFLVL